MRKILIVIDMQNDFIDGALGTSEAVTIVPNVIEKILSDREYLRDQRYASGELSGNAGGEVSSGKALHSGNRWMAALQRDC